MKESIRKKVELLVSNKAKIDKEFTFGDGIMHIASSLVFTGADKEVDIAKFRQCSSILKKKTGMFSSFRSTSEAFVVSKMAMSDDPEKFIDSVKAIYNLLSKALFVENAYLIQGAICIYEADRVAEAEQIAQKTKQLYKMMSKKHPILTSSEDIVYVILLAMTDKSVETLYNELEDCYTYLKREVRLRVSDNEFQGLSEILALTDGDIREKTDKVVALYKTITAHGIKWGDSYNEFGSLGSLIDLEVDNDTLVNEIVEVNEYLKKCKGFGSWTLDNKQRLMFSAMLLGGAYAEEKQIINRSAVNSTVAMIIAEEVALMICMMICMSSTTSSAAIN